MATFLIVTLGISIVGMVSLLLLKRYELSTGRVLLGSARPAVGEFFHRALWWVEFALPGIAKLLVRRLYRVTRALLHATLAWVVVKVEQVLEHALHRVRHTTTSPGASAKSSVFLRQVAEHKKKLQDELPERGTTVEE